jgi:hypothetical protein
LDPGFGYQLVRLNLGQGSRLEGEDRANPLSAFNFWLSAFLREHFKPWGNAAAGASGGAFGRPGRADYGLAGEDPLALLVVAGRQHPDAALDRVDLHDLDPCGDGVADLDGSQEGQFLAQINRAWARQPVPHHGRDEPRRQQAVGDPRAEIGFSGVFLVDVRRVEIPCNPGKKINVRLADRLGELGAVSHLELIDRFPDHAVTPFPGKLPAMVDRKVYFR